MLWPGPTARANKMVAVKRLLNFLAPWAEMMTAYPLWFYPGTILGFSSLVALTPLANIFDFNEQFFSAAAEVFPVLLIAMFAELLFEAEAFRETPHRTWRRCEGRF